MILSGCYSARSSMLVPPWLQPISIAPTLLRSSKIAEYISRASFILWATYSVLTGLPAGPVCLAPSIWLASFDDWAAHQMWTPPCRPLVKRPRPRPPARIWLLSTT